MAAIVQHITYKEFLPMLLGKDTMKAFGLTLLDEGYSDTYDSSVDVTVTASFITAAFRFGHSLLPSTIERWSAATNSYIGDDRVNEQLVLSVLHTMFVREHNRMADELSRINPHWDDERIYQTGCDSIIVLEYRSGEPKREPRWSSSAQPSTRLTESASQ
ncbi:hypothetical protein J437_LFUL017507 [Ladona fulva]|uniref:Chorion peroxidase n=1 Tax=Ladona fulva TaxID=123851 RepID=A0A8K0KRL0_LADFU|nr:hypothetical protein J437_LFUL017507 [Ladona fulva]